MQRAAQNTLLGIAIVVPAVALGSFLALLQVVEPHGGRGRDYSVALGYSSAFLFVGLVLCLIPAARRVGLAFCLGALALWCVHYVVLVGWR